MRYKRTERLLLVAQLGTTLALSARAEDIHTAGAGLSSCGSWTAERQNPQGMKADMAGSWTLGFLTGTAWPQESRFDPLRGVDADVVYGFLDKHCKAHPSDKIVDAAIAFLQQHPR